MENLAEPCEKATRFVNILPECTLSDAFLENLLRPFVSAAARRLGVKSRTVRHGDEEINHRIRCRLFAR